MERRHFAGINDRVLSSRTAAGVAGQRPAIHNAGEDACAP